MAQVLSDFLLKPVYKSSFDRFFTILSNIINSQETLVLALALFQQRIEFSQSSNKADKAVSRKYNNLNQFMDTFKVKLKQMDSFRQVEETMRELKRDRDFWVANWENWSLQVRPNKDTFKIFLPRLVNQIIRQTGHKDFEQLLTTNEMSKLEMENN